MKKIAFLDFWDDSIVNIFTTLKLYLPLSDYILTENIDNSELIFYSVFGQTHKKYNKKKLFFSGENRRRWNYSSFDIENTVLYLCCNTHEDYPELPKEKFIYFPFFFLYAESIPFSLQESKKEKFCCIVVSNQDSNLGCILRKKFFDELSKYKHVDSAGPAFNNTGYLAPKDPKEYFNWINQYRFMITFENSFGKGYVTEKLFNGLCGGVIPVYWGDNTKAKELFKESNFLCLETGDNSYEKIKEGINQLISKIKDLDENYISKQIKLFTKSTIEYREKILNIIEKTL